MPPINPVISAGVIALSVAVVAAIVVYENPEVRRMADDLKRRVAVAVQNIGDNMAPDGPAAARRRRRNSEEAAAAGAAADGSDEPLFNRPEDAEGFLMSRGGLADGDSAGVVADEETRRRQREELMYWNRLQMQRQKQEEQASRSSNSNSNSNNTRWQPRDALEAMQRVTRDAAAAAGIRISPLGGGQPTSSRVSISFDQLLRPDTSAADRGTYVINTDEATGTTSSSNANIGESLLRHRRPEAAAAAAAAAIAVHSQATAYANPFSDEYGIELDEDLEEQRQQLRAYEEAHALSRAQQASSNVSANANANVSSFDRDDIMSDIYSATEPDTNAAVTENNKIDAVFDPLPAIAEQQQQQQQQTVPGSVSNASQSDVIFDANDYSTPTETLGRASASVTTDNDSHASELLQQLQNAVALNDSYVNAGQQQQQQEEEDSASAVNAEAFNSIQAWAQDSSSASLAGFYSPLPVTPNTAMSEPSVISSGGDGDGDGDGDGQMTPTESMSIIGSAAGDYDVASEDESEGVMTPTSWSEVGSVVSESESSMHA